MQTSSQGTLDYSGFNDVDRDEDNESDGEEFLLKETDAVKRAKYMYGIPQDLKNTYEIQGMSDMSTDEYIAAMNERTKKFQAERREKGTMEKDPTRDYFDSL